MEYQLHPSFKKTFRNFSLKRKKKVKESIQKLVIFFETGEKTVGLGLKKLEDNFWEIRTNLKDRILFTFKRKRVGFVIVGIHKQIKNYLRHL